MEIILILMVIETIIIFVLNKKYEESKFKNSILMTENKSLRRVMYENDLIPREFLKDDK